MSEPPVPGDDVADVHAAAEEFERAVVANDADAISALVTPDWVLVDGDGVGGRGTFLDLVASGDLVHNAMATVEGTERIRIHGDTAVRTARVTNTAEFGGRRFDADEWTTDVYIRTGTGWRCVASHTTPVAEA
ncbi:nuclear transport factor 2 family protein [Rhodococcus rhodnii]|uniref:DUF4440 domain-containing protein n=2 Tax=Rhodococcus rhodnii TaxID=38312 RepID=R7WL68_9NOCA|nr:nuclear transport factor 2 family protein [Rhodococcus rhodnii]EOM74739.1 hypothetical protein Rrhod_3902 [Rhodococcus rhodnii LMG 5362]TXG89840.1 nuclear transport factor 2 family protein [Rhodococcus rhodnii]